MSYQQISISDNVLLANRFGNQGVINIANNFTCGRNYILGEIPVYAAPYLYPFVVEYSLIASAVIFAMWRSIGSNPRYVHKNHIIYRDIDPSHFNFEKKIPSMIYFIKLLEMAEQPMAGLSSSDGKNREGDNFQNYGRKNPCIYM